MEYSTLNVQLYYPGIFNEPAMSDEYVAQLQNLNEKNAAKLDVFVYEVVKYGTKSRVFNNVNDCSDFMHQWKLDKHSIQTCAYEEDSLQSLH